MHIHSWLKIFIYEYSEQNHMAKLIQIVVCDEKHLSYIILRGVLSKKEWEVRGKVFPMTWWRYEDT